MDDWALTYDKNKVVSAFSKFLQVKDENIINTETFQHDLVDVTRQVN